ncbi:MAG: hypothetical protein IH987_13275, partial [Planctomycetes bacterium]|nr:hypothetical protein [Planctomycetota bacterium]
MSCRRCGSAKSLRQPRSSRFRLVFFGLALFVHLPWANQESRAAVDLVGSWSGETQFETNGFNYTPGAGTNRVVLIVVAAESNGNPVANVNQVTLGGQTLTAIEDADGVVVGTGGSFHNVLWLGYLNESGISSMSGNTLSVTWDQTPNTPFGEIMVQAATYQDVDQLVPVAASASNTNTSASSIQAGSVTPGTGDRLVYVALDGQPGNHTAPGGYTEQLEQDGPANDFSCASVQRDATTSSTENPTASWSVTSRQVIISVVLTEHVVIDLANGLVAFWKLNEGSGTNATDSSSNTNDGTLTNSPAWTDGVHGGAVDFDGVDDYIGAGSDASIDDMWAGGGTFAAWCFIEGAGETNFGRFADKASDVDATVGWAIQMNNGTTSIRLEAGFSTTRGIWNSGTNSVSANSWYHVAVVYDSDSAANDPLIYINGVSKTVTNSTPPVGTYNTDAAIALRIGNFAGDTTRTFDGSLDDIRIYSRELSTGEIVRLANGSGLIGHWKLDDASGTTANDSGGSNDGTLTNGPTWNTAGKLCGALDFNEPDNEYVSISANATLNISTDATITGWFKLDATFNSSTATSQVIMDKYLDDGNDLLIALIGTDYGQASVADGSLLFKIEEGGSDARYTWTTQTSWTAGQWYHFAVALDVTDNTSNQIYIDGSDNTAGGSGTGTTETMSFNADINIGGKDTDSSQLAGAHYFDGVIDDVRIFNRVLLHWEIQSLAATYQVIDLGSASGEPSLGICVNDSEQVGGFDETAAAGDSTAWFQQYCEFTTIATLTGGSVNEALGINNAGTVVGWSAAAGGIFKAFSWTSGGGTIDLGLLSGRTDSEALGVNSSNEVCGTALNIGPPPTSRLAFLYLPVAAYSL